MALHQCVLTLPAAGRRLLRVSADLNLTVITTLAHLMGKLRHGVAKPLVLSFTARTCLRSSLAPEPMLLNALPTQRHREVK